MPYERESAYPGPVRGRILADGWVITVNHVYIKLYRPENHPGPQRHRAGEGVDRAPEEALRPGGKLVDSVSEEVGIAMPIGNAIG